MSGTVKTRQDLAGAPTSPFTGGNTPADSDYDDLLASVFFPGEDTTDRIAVDETTQAFWLSYFAALTLEADGRLGLNTVLNYFLTYVLDRLASPQFVLIEPSVTFVDVNTFTVPADVTETVVAGKRIRATQDGDRVYGTVSTAVFAAGTTTVNLVMDAGDALTSELDTAEVSLMDWDAAPPVTDPTEAQVLTALGYTPADVAGDTFAGAVGASKFVANGGAAYGKLTVSNTPPSPGDGADGDIWFIY